MDKLNLTFKEGDVLYASQLTTIVQTLNSVIDNINTAVESISSGSAAPTYDYTFEFYEGYVLAYNLVIYKHLGDKTYKEKSVSYSSGVSAMEKALQDAKLGNSLSLTLTVQERTTDDNFTQNENPKYIRCGATVQANGWQLAEGNEPGQGHASFAELQRYNYPTTGRLGWNSGLDVDGDGTVNNPPTEFEVYSNPSIYKIGAWESFMDGVNPNVAENIEGLSIIKAVKGTLTVGVDNNPSTTYTNEMHVRVAKDNVLMAGYTVLRASDPTTPTWQQFKANPGDYVLKDVFTKYYRVYLSYPEYYPSTTLGQRGYKKAFSRFPQSGFYDTDVTYQNVTLANMKMTLHEGDIFIYFKKDESIIGTNVYLSAITTGSVRVYPTTYGVPGHGWQLPTFGDYFMHALDNNDWISYYDTAHALPNGTLIGGKNDSLHYHPNKYSIPYEEWVNKPDGTKLYRFGGNDYQIFAFRVNKELELSQLSI